MIDVKILLDSVNKYGNRLTTWELTFPRFILPEWNTHRCFSRNAASSRAIPINKVIEKIREEPAFFEQLGLNQAGMQAVELLSEELENDFKWSWFHNASVICNQVEVWANRFNLHKQILNRILEPFQHITVIASATEHDNFFNLRAHKDAQPEFQVLAYRMLDKYIYDNPTQRTEHLPLYEKGLDDPDHAVETSIARCARVSYCRHLDMVSVDKDIELFNRLKESGHWSPFEHVAFEAHGKVAGNFRGWRQLRHLYDQKKTVDLRKILNNKPEWIKF